MRCKSVEIYGARKNFFNESADKWIDMWYRDQKTGEQKKHKKDFARLFSMIPLRNGDFVLDAGCGTGIIVPYILAAIGPKGKLYELDFAERMIEINRTLHRQENIQFIVSDVENAPLDDKSCDVAICFSCFPHFQDKEKSIQTIGRILKDNGVLVIAHFASSEGINNHHKSCHAVMHDHLPTGAAMREMIANAGFNLESFVDEKNFYYIQARKNNS